MCQDTDDSRHKLNLVNKGKAVEVVSFFLLTWLYKKKSFAARNAFFKSEMEASAFKAEKHRIVLVGRSSEDHLVQHPAPSRTTASTWSGRPRLGLALSVKLAPVLYLPASENVFHNAWYMRPLPLLHYLSYQEECSPISALEIVVSRC